MARNDTLIVKETHRGLLYEDGILREVLPAGRHKIPRPPSSLGQFFGAKDAQIEVVLIDIRSRDRTIVVPEILTADGATISASFVVQFQVVEPRDAVHRVKNYEERLYSEAQTAARRALRALTLEEVMGCRDEIGEELHRLVGESAKGYGLEVSSVDFKDLILPEEFRIALNQAAFAKRFRPIESASSQTRQDSFDLDGEGSLGGSENSVGDSGALRIELGRLNSDRATDSSEKSAPLRPLAFETLEEGSHATNFERIRQFGP